MYKVYVDKSRFDGRSPFIRIGFELSDEEGEILWKVQFVNYLKESGWISFTDIHNIQYKFRADVIIGLERYSD